MGFKRGPTLFHSTDQPYHLVGFDCISMCAGAYALDLFTFWKRLNGILLDKTDPKSNNNLPKNY